MEIRKIEWTGRAGNKIELRAWCETKMEDDISDADGYKINHGKKPVTRADLELYLDGEKQDHCWNTDFWKIVDAGNGVKKIWGLKVGMDPEQAEKVDAFLKAVIEDGKTVETKKVKAAEAEATHQNNAADAEKIVKAAETTHKNADGSLMTNAQAKVWELRYNNLHNEGGEGYVPRVITQEAYDWAREILNR